MSDKDQTTTPGISRPALCDKSVNSLTFSADCISEDAGDGTYLQYKYKKYVTSKTVTAELFFFFFSFNGRY